jgi:predicted ATP-grasp superfamily ATP-dependent carboligase
LGVKLCPTPRDLQEFVANVNTTEEIQVQEFVSGFDCSKQYFVSKHGAAPLTNTDQIMSNRVNHIGNASPSCRFSRLDNANLDLAASLIWQQGYRGHMSIDVIKPAGGGSAQVIEINLRPGAVTVPTSIASQLGVKAFVLRKVNFPTRSVLEEALRRFSITPDRCEGALPTVIRPRKDGQLEVELVCISRSGGHVQVLDIIDRLTQYARSSKS